MQHVRLPCVTVAARHIYSGAPFPSKRAERGRLFSAERACVPADLPRTYAPLKLRQVHEQAGVAARGVGGQ